MTFPVYTTSQLNSYNRSQLWLICEQLNIPKYPASQDCRDAIAQKQPKLVAKLEAKQNELVVTEITFYDHELTAGNKVVAMVSYDHSDFVTQPWVVSINGVEVFRWDTQARCVTWVRTHYVAGTLPSPAVVEEPQPQPKPETTPLLCPVCHGQGVVPQGDDIVETCQYCDGQGSLYTLQYVFGAAPRTYRVYNSNDSMIGVIFEHINYWSNAMDGIKHFEAIDAAVCLDALMKAKPQLV